MIRGIRQTSNASTAGWLRSCLESGRVMCSSTADRQRSDDAQHDHSRENASVSIRPAVRPESISACAAHSPIWSDDCELFGVGPLTTGPAFEGCSFGLKRPTATSSARAKRGGRSRGWGPATY
jgi:hypothetical protein